MKMLFLLLVVGALAFDSNRSASSEDLHPGIIGEDARVPLEAQGAPWDAVGQVNVAAFRLEGLCTGTLVKPTLVLTAAHCVMNPITGKPFPPTDIHFLAGVRGGDNKGVATALCVHLLPTYRDNAVPHKTPLEDRISDAAVIVLSSRLNVSPAPIDEEVAPKPGLRLTHVAYPGATGSSLMSTGTAACCGPISWRAFGSTTATRIPEVRAAPCSRGQGTPIGWLRSCWAAAHASIISRCPFRGGLI